MIYDIYYMIYIYDMFGSVRHACWPHNSKGAPQRRRCIAFKPRMYTSQWPRTMIRT